MTVVLELTGAKVKTDLKRRDETSLAEVATRLIETHPSLNSHTHTHLDKCILHSRTDVHEVHTLTACTKLPCDASWGMSCRAIMIVRLRQQCRQSLTLAQASSEVRTQIENFAGTSWGRLPMISQANWSVFVGARLQNAPCTPC